MLILLVLWPIVMAGILLFPSGSPDKDDVLSVLHQECFYALALVTVTAASILGNEQRSRRSVFVLARAVSRSQYLLSALLSALISSLIFIFSFEICGLLLVSETGGSATAITVMALLQFILCIWFAAVAVFFSVFLPAILASVAVSLAGAAVFLLGRHAALVGVPRLIPDMLAISLAQPKSAISGTAVVSVLVQSACVFFLAVYLFNRRDLQMTDS
jgi:hypothetical protein